jgi:hypothetical protein
MRQALLLLFAAAFAFSSCNDLFNTFGKKVAINDKSDVYYKDGATEADARQLGDALLKLGYFDNTKAKSVQVTKDKDSAYLVRLVYDQSVYNKNRDQMNLRLWFFQDLLSDNAFNGKKARIALADDKLKEFETIDDVQKVKQDGHNVYYRGSGVSESTAKNYVQKLDEGKFFDETNGDVLLTKERGSYTLRFMPNPDKFANKETYYATMENLQYLFSKYVFDGDDVRLVVLDEDFGDAKSFNDISSDRKAALDQRMQQNMQPQQQQQQQDQTNPYPQQQQTPQSGPGQYPQQQQLPQNSQ